MSQLPLSVGLPGTASFGNYVSGPNTQALGALREWVDGTGPRVLFLWGSQGTGKTHLVEAVCRQLRKIGQPVAFVPLGGVDDIDPALLEGLEATPFICIDNLDGVLGRQPWEHALFNLYNEAERTHSRLLLTGATSTATLSFGLEDLRSRIAAALTFQLRTLDESDRERAVQMRARERGFEIPQDVADYLMRRYPRSMHELIDLVEKLDHSTLAAQRRVTIPFVKSLLDG